MQTLEIDNVSFSVSGVQIIRDLSLTNASGEWIAVLGANGAGKSTLLRIAAGLISPLQGRVLLEGSLLSTLSRAAVARRVSLVPQRIAALPEFTVAEFLHLSRGVHNADSQFESSMFSPEELSSKLLTQLSGGELQRALIAGALAQGARLLLLDEPTNNLDPAAHIELQALFTTLRNRREHSCLFITHDITLAMRCADRVVVMREGSIIWSGVPESAALLGALENAFATRFVKVAHPHSDYDIVVPA
jgi:iron complex transport system ATP-binding protein